tara:strand:+ start:865 stop:1722 length:858 start_codon:yes stop_codon:yes gene_type:complete
MLHSAMGDSLVAFRHIIKFSEENKEKKINVIYNQNIDPFMKNWTWPDNITLMPLEQTVHDFDNLYPFPYKCDNQEIVEAFHKKQENAHDLRPFFVQRDHLVVENNLKDILPDRAPFVHSIGSYVALQPISTIHQAYSIRWIDEEMETYEKFLINLLEHIHMLTPLSVVAVGTHDDAAKFPHFNSIKSNNRYFNLMGHLNIEDYCDTIQHSSAVFGLSSSAINLGNYVFGKPVVSWRLRPPWGDLFDNFLDDNSKAIHRPWEQEMNFYSDFLEKGVLNEKKQNINS